MQTATASPTAARQKMLSWDELRTIVEIGLADSVSVALSYRELADLIGTTSPGAQHRVSRLVDAGLLTRTSEPRSIRLTERGRQLYENAMHLSQSATVTALNNLRKRTAPASPAAHADSHTLSALRYIHSLDGAEVDVGLLALHTGLDNGKARVLGDRLFRLRLIEFDPAASEDAKPVILTPEGIALLNAYDTETEEPA